VTDGVDGRLVPPGDPVALAGAIVELLRDSDLRRRLGDAGHATVADRFSIDAQVRRIQVVYDEELARAGVLLNGDRGSGVVPAERGALELPPL
jgi:glycosyltransferase involved in cell wall biosynthesis